VGMYFGFRPGFLSPVWLSEKTHAFAPGGPAGTMWELDQALHSMKRHFRKTFLIRSPLLALITEPPTQSSGRAYRPRYRLC